MIIENVPSEFLLLEEPVCVFSDDSRFIYMLMRWLDPLSISVYDSVYNRFVTLLPDTSVTDLPHIDKFQEGSVRPSILLINNTTLLILFNDVVSNIFYGTGAVLLVVVQLNFCNKTFSILDSKIIKDCHSAEARLVKNGFQYLIIHTVAIDKIEYIANDQFLAYFTFYLDNELKLKIQETRIVFDFDYRNSGYIATWNVCNNKLWCIRHVGRTSNKELLYFDLNESNAKSKSVEIFEVGGEIQAMFQWSDNVLLKYYPDNGEFSYLDLNTDEWSNSFQRCDLHHAENSATELKRFQSFDTSGTCVTFERHFDYAFNAIIFDKIRNQLLKLPFRIPAKLTEIAWITVLNNNLLNELDKSKIIIYPKLF